MSQNQRRVLDAIRRHGPLARTELTPLTNLTPGAITRHIRELLLLGLVEEQDRRSGMRGQPAVPLAVASSGGYSIGISLTPNRLDMTALDYAGNVLTHRSGTIESEDVPTLLSALDDVSQAIESDLPTAGADRLVGVGFALSAHGISPSHSFLHLAPTIAWIDPEALKAWCLKRWGGELFFVNIANAAALAELKAANNPQLQDLIGFNLGHGVGAGIILNRRIHAGTKGIAGAIGGLFPHDTPRPTRRDLMIALRSAGRDVPSTTALEDIDPSKDPIASAWVERVAMQLTPVVRAAWLLLTPQEIVLTSIPPSLGKPIAHLLAQNLALVAGSMDVPKPDVLAARLGVMSSAIGAAWLPIEAEGAPLEGETYPPSQ